MKGVKRMPYDRARKAATTHLYDYVTPYVADLGNTVDLALINRGRTTIEVPDPESPSNWQPTFTVTGPGPRDRTSFDRLSLSRGRPSRPLPASAAVLGAPPAVLGFRSDWHAEAAALVPNAEVVIDPVLVTDAMPLDRHVLACGPEPMLEAVRALAPDAQLAWEATMACGYGACYGCVVEIDGELKRLCVDGPVLSCFS